MSSSDNPRLLGGRLALDFCNELQPSFGFTWDALLRFLQLTRIISGERSGQLLSLRQSDPNSAEALLTKAHRLQAALASAFVAILNNRQSVPRDAVEPINQILGITEGHDELVLAGGVWQLEFVARESGLDWLLAAVARSGAEIIAEGSARLRSCANPSCGLFFYDTSRTGKRRWCSMARCGNRHKVAAFSRRHGASRRLD